jgi:hypothetical protein
MDAITTVEARRKQAVSPTFVNIVGDGRRHASPPQAAMREILGLDALNAVTDCWCERISRHLSELDVLAHLREPVSDFLGVGFCVATFCRNFLMQIRKFYSGNV